MKKKYKDIWLKALRAGEYAQGTGALCRLKNGEHEFCCLGVLVNEIEGFDSLPISFRPAIHDGYKGTLSGRLMKMTELRPLERNKLISMNDSGSSFPEIADYIEANL